MVRESVVMVMAEWIEDYDYDGDYCYCSECGHYLEPYELLPHLIIPNECPDCGAKMDLESESK
nr:MAG TPA: 50S ribosomal protein L19 [Caudoviricetes sp.]